MREVKTGDGRCEMEKDNYELKSGKMEIVKARDGKYNDELVMINDVKKYTITRLHDYTIKDYCIVKLKNCKKEFRYFVKAKKMKFR